MEYAERPEAEGAGRRRPRLVTEKPFECRGALAVERDELSSHVIPVLAARLRAGIDPLDVEPGRERFPVEDNLE